MTSVTTEVVTVADPTLPEAFSPVVGTLAAPVMVTELTCPEADDPTPVTRALPVTLVIVPTSPEEADPVTPVETSVLTVETPT